MSSKYGVRGTKLDKKPLSHKPSLNTVFIVGTTASGKTATALKVAKELDGEIICADSQTLRKDLDIGTAKPTPQEQKLVKHHMLDLIDPYERFSVAEFKRQAQVVIADIQKRSKLPIIVGGTGLYIDALFYDYDLKNSSEDRALYEEMSIDKLQQLIKERGFEMPENKQNPRHLVGVIARGGKTSENKQPVNGARIYGIVRPDEDIKKRISLRIEKMFENGLVDEVKEIVKKYGNPPNKLDAICYPIVQKYLDRELTLTETKELFKRADWQYARRQKAWFKRNKFIQWYKSELATAEAIIKDIKQSEAVVTD